MNNISKIKQMLFVSKTDLANNSAKFAADSQRSFFSLFLFLSSLAVESAKQSVLRKKCCSHTRWWYACALCFWQRLANGICKEIRGLSSLLVLALLWGFFSEGWRIVPWKTWVSETLGGILKSRERFWSLVFAWFVFIFLSLKTFYQGVLGLRFLTRTLASWRVSHFTILHPFSG